VNTDQAINRKKHKNEPPTFSDFVPSVPFVAIPTGVILSA
jgi:hypothetical protein